MKKYQLKQTFFQKGMSKFWKMFFKRTYVGLGGTNAYKTGIGITKYVTYVQVYLSYKHVGIK